MEWLLSRKSMLNESILQTQLQKRLSVHAEYSVFKDCLTRYKATTYLPKNICKYKSFLSIHYSNSKFLYQAAVCQSNCSIYWQKKKLKKICISNWVSPSKISLNKFSFYASTKTKAVSVTQWAVVVVMMAMEVMAGLWVVMVRMIVVVLGLGSGSR